MDGIGGGSGGLAGDNVQELLRSKKLIKATLLSPMTAQGPIPWLTGMLRVTSWIRNA
jgi:hypothetical protein